MADRSYRWLLYTLALIGLAADQVSKYGIFSWLAGVPGNNWVVFRAAPDEGFQLVAQYDAGPDGTKVPHVNHGALFGFLRQHKTLANLGFAVISLLAATAIVLWSLQKTTAQDRWLCAALGLILAGTLGNLYDRLLFNGVRDFLHWNYLFDWPVFNFADCCLVGGAGLLLLQAFVAQPTAAPNTEPADASCELPPDRNEAREQVAAVSGEISCASAGPARKG
jgi:lipoprotein signal peptidase